MPDLPLSLGEAERFQQQMHDQNRLVIWCVTHDTKDFGNKYTARPIVVPNPGPDRNDGYLIANSLNELRQLLPRGLALLDRSPNDDPVIVETWL